MDKNPKRISFLVIGMLLVQSLSGQATFRSRIFQSYVQSDRSLWEKTLNDPQFVATTLEDRYERAMALYGFIGLCVDTDEKEKAKTSLDQLISLSDELLRNQPDEARFMALRAATYGMQMIMQKHLMMTLGPKSVKTLQKASEIGADIPQVLVEMGNQYWAMPGVFGGDKEKANRLYRSAVMMLQKDAQSLAENWYFLKIQMILADRYAELGFTNQAKALYQSLLVREPGFKLARIKLELL